MKKGFTLIELLGVIVVLSLIALVTIPIVLDMISDSKKGAVESSADHYIDAVELAVATNSFEGKKTNGDYVVNNDGNLCLETEGPNCTNPIMVEISGDYPKIGSTITINKGLVLLDSVELRYGEYVVNYNTKKSKMLATNFEPYAIGTKYVLDPGDGILRNFYVIEDGDNTTLTKGKKGVLYYSTDKKGTSGEGEISLILDRDIGTTTVTWDASGNITNGPVTALAYLDSQTSGWTVEVNLPTQNQLTAIMNLMKNDTDLTRYPWLYINSTSGYWTSTAVVDPNIERVYDVRADGRIVSYTPHNLLHGIRPVITIPKSQLK